MATLSPAKSPEQSRRLARNMSGRSEHGSKLLKRLRDLALFNLSIDSKLRGCDLVSLKIVDVAPNGYAVDRASVRQRKTGRAVRFEITEQTRQAIDDHLSHRSEASSPYLFPGYGPASHLTTRQYARLLGHWLTMIGLAARRFPVFL
jgi:integrase